MDGDPIEAGQILEYNVFHPGEDYSATEILKIIPNTAVQEESSYFNPAYIQVNDIIPYEEQLQPEGFPLSEYRATFQPIRNQYILSRDWWQLIYGFVDYGVDEPKGFVYESTDHLDGCHLRLRGPMYDYETTMVVAWNSQVYNNEDDATFPDGASKYGISLEVGDVILVDDELMLIEDIIEMDWDYLGGASWTLRVERGYRRTLAENHDIYQSIRIRKDLSWVYHLDVGSWTKMDGLLLEKAITLSGGQNTWNINLFVAENGLEVHQYPGTYEAEVEATIKTKEFYLEKGVLRRIRADYEGDAEVKTYIKNKDVDNSDTVIEDYKYIESGLSLSVLENVEDNEWKLIPQDKSRGRSAQIRITNASKIKSIQMEFKTKGGEK